MRQVSNSPLPTFVVTDPIEAARELALRLRDLVAEQPNFVLGCATGHTPISTYQQLAGLASSRAIFGGLRTFNLDEYHGLASDHPGSFESFMRRHLFAPLDLSPERTLFPRCCEGESPVQAAERFETKIQESGGIDLQLLGIGRNGHIAFNEPGSARDSRTRLVELTASTRAANAPDFPDGTPVPTGAMTMGIGTILDARRLHVLAFGVHKAEIVRRALREPASREIPASFLREHEQVELWLDDAAASSL